MRFLAFIRWREWGPDKLPFFFTFFFYSALADRVVAFRFLLEFLAGAVFVSALAVFGYLANDLGDRGTDRAEEKKNSLRGLAPRTLCLVFTGVFAVMVAAAGPFAGRKGFMPLWAAQLLAATAYSLPPLRLKGRGLWGLVSNVAAQFTLPALLVFAAMGHRMGAGIIAMTAAATAHGAAAEIGHQLFHLAADRAAGIRTFAVRAGAAAGERVYRAALALERLALGGMVMVLLAGIPPLNLLPAGRFPPALPLAAVYLFLLVRAGGLDDPYYFRGRRPAANLLHAVFPHLVVPFYLSLLLACSRPSNLLLPVFFLAWVSPGVTGEKIRRIAEAARAGPRGGNRPAGG